MKSVELAVVAGARPNFMKIAPLLHAIEQQSVLSATLIHTGQHYDANLSSVFFEELEIKEPDVHLGVGKGSHGEQTARVIEKTEKVLSAGVANGRKFDCLVVVGDVNSTMAASLAAAKLGIPIAHVEAGLRSFDRTMPEEINRLVTDSISQILLASEPSGIKNLQAEGHPDCDLHLVGNVMIDTLRQHVDRAKRQPALQRYALTAEQYAVVTMHRPANVDHRETLGRFADVLCEVSAEIPVVFPVHPRTKSRLQEFELFDSLNTNGVQLVEPLGYKDFLCLTSQAKVVITDSGGLQEETTALGIPCLTLRPNTERPITIDHGTSTLVGDDTELLKDQLHRVLSGTYKNGSCPELWDGKAAWRIVKVLTERLSEPHRFSDSP